MDDKGQPVESEFEIPKAERGLEARQEQAIEAKPASEAASELPAQGRPTPAVDPQSLALPAAAVLADDQTIRTPAAKPAVASQPARADQKQWVAKAKAVIAKTQDDPHAQASAISRVKAGYIQANFNKTVKLSED